VEGTRPPESAGAVGKGPVSAQVELAEARNVLAEERTLLANERTVLAWWRTAFACYALAIGFGGIVPSLSKTSDKAATAFAAIGICFALVGILITVDGILRYRRLEGQVSSGVGYPRGAQRRIMLIGSAIIVLGLAAAIVLVVEQVT